ncbi:hypothetical protein [Micromonospora musae]|uniref:hypothetical protein n=1 Tax=Micromonospora musae TaxID=1894970 RepID=UPI00342A320F
MIIYAAAVPATPTLAFDPGAAYDEVKRLRTALLYHDWPTLRQLLDAAEPGVRSHLVRFAADWGGIELSLRDQLARAPEDPHVPVLLAARLIAAGWRIRGRAMASYVDDDRFAEFHDHLRRAEQLLIDVTARHPDDVAAWTQRLLVARGLQLGQAEARRRYDRLARHLPHHLPAQSALLQQLCPKWGGGWELAHAFARECAEAAPPGAGNAVLVVEAHLEESMEAIDVVRRREHLRGPQVTAEIQAAAERSVSHEDFRHTYGWVAVRSTFAMAFHLMGDYRAARDQFEALGPYTDQAMFGYHGEWRAAFTRARDESYARGGRR